MEIISIVVKYTTFFIAFISSYYLLSELKVFRFFKYKNILFYKKFRFLFYDNKNEIISNLEQLNKSQIKYVYHITEAEKIKGKI